MQDCVESEAAGYDFQFHGVIEMLEKFHDKLVDERLALEESEMNGQHAHQMLVQELTAQIVQVITDRSEKAESRAKTLQAKADAEGDFQEATTIKEADEKCLADLTAICE